MEDELPPAGARWLRLAAATLLIVVSGFAAIYLAESKVGARRNEGRPSLLKVDVVPAQLADLTIPVVSYGLVHPRRIVRLAAEVTGQADSLRAFLKPGTVVSAGSFLLSVDPSRYKEKLANLRAQMRQLGARIASLREERAFRREALDLAGQKLALEKRHLARSDTLYRAGRIDENEIVALQRNVLGAEEGTRALREKLGLMWPELTRLQAESLSLVAQIRLSALDLEDCVLRSPVDGRIRSVTIEQFDAVRANEALFEIDDLSWLEVEVPLKLSDLASFPDSGESVSCSVILSLGDKREEVWGGAVTAFLPVDSETQTRKAIVRVSDPRGKLYGIQLLPDLFCRIEIELTPLHDVIYIPRSLVGEDGRIPLFVDGNLELREVVTGRNVGGLTVITGGLSPGDLVVSSKISILVDGMRLELRGEL